MKALPSILYKLLAKNRITLALSVIVYLSLALTSKGYGQIRVPFAPRTALETPAQTVYRVKGDFTMIGNTNLTLVDYSDERNNNNDMEYVDVDTDTNTLNSSSATLTLSTENGAIPECSNILFAGLYWSGRAAGQNDVDSRTFDVTKDGVTKTFDKQRVLIQGPGASAYEPVNSNGVIAFPTNGDDFNIYSAYADVTEYVRTHGIGEYFVADIATREGNADFVGYFGGWGMVVVFENPKMRFRDISVFDGHAFVRDGSDDFNIPISGFNAVENGDVNFKLGVMAGEGDVIVAGDILQMLRQDTNTFESLSHSGNNVFNFFNSSILTSGARNPNLPNNTGIDIAMFDVDNGNNNLDPTDDNKFIDNLQTSTTIKYASNRDTYAIFNVTFSIEAFVPEPEVVVSNVNINGESPSTTNATLEPNETADFNIQIKNTGTEALNNTVLTIPIPTSVNSSDFNITTTNTPPFTPNSAPTFDPSIGANGAIVWDLGTLPLPTPANPDGILATLNLSLTVTTNCSILGDPTFPSEVAVSGTISGIGAVSNVPFNKELIRGFETNGICEGSPLTGPLTIPINATEYVNTPPTASNPDDITVQCAADIPTVDPTIVDDEADNSGIAPTVAFVSDVSDNNSNPETITRTYSVTDDCDNTILVTQTITVNDTEAPTITCPENIDVNTSTNNPGDCTTTANLGIPTTDDNCGVTQTIAQVEGNVIDPTTFLFELGDTTVTWIASDAAGNTASCDQTVTVLDNENPVALCQNIEIALDATGNATITAEDIDNNSTDNCGIANRVASQTTFTCDDIGDNTVTITVTDNSGNENTCDAIVTVVNPILPTITCPADIVTTTANDSTGNCTTTVDLSAPTATNNCDINTVVASVDGNTIDPATFEFGLGTTTVTWTVTNSSGIPASCDQQVTVTDNEMPNAICQSLTVTLDDVTNTVSITTDQIDNGSTDNCDTNLDFSLSQTLFTCDNVGDNTVTLSVTDQNNNTSTCTATVTVEDNINPVAVCQNIEIALDATGTATITADQIDNNSTDNCGIANRVASQTTFTCDDIGDNTVTLTVTDNSGNENTCDAIVTVVNPILPTITCPANIVTTTANDSTGNCTTTVNLGAPTATNNCDINTVVASVDGNTIDPTTFEFGLGTTTVTWTVTNSSGIPASCDQQVTVTDNEMPNAICQSLTVALDDVTNTVSITTDQINNGSTDNCDTNLDFSLSQTLFTCDNVGDNTVTLSVTDQNNNTSTCTAIVTVEDNTIPVALCQNIEIALDATGTATITADQIDNNSTDNCGIATLTASQTTFTCANIGENTVTLTVRDNSGNENTCDAIVTVVNPILPTITCPADIVTTTANDSTGNCTTTVDLGIPTATNNCDINTVIALVDGNIIDPATFEFGLGLTTVTWMVTDSSGNTSSCVQDVTVTDNEMPIITECPQDISVTADLGTCTASNVTLSTPIATDNCSLAPNGITNDAPTTYVLGENTVTWTVTDASGNSTTCQQIVTVTDNENPIALCQSIQIELDASGTATITANDIDNNSTDNCGIAERIASQTTFTCADIGDNTVTLTVRDNSGNENTCNTTVTVINTSIPTITCPRPVVTTTSTDGTGNCTTTVDLGTPTATNNCDINTIIASVNGVTIDPVTFEFDLGITVVTWTVTDSSGNPASCDQNVTVTDDEMPVITECPQDVSVTADPGACTASNLTLNLPVATDNCSLNPNGITNNAPAQFPLGNTTVIWTVRDASGNIATCEQIVTVTDGELPQVTCPAPVTVNTDLNSCEATNVALGALDIEDCTAVTVTNNAPLSFPLGDTIVIWNVVDAAGNTNTCEQTVTVIDNQNPVFDTFVANIAVECDAVPEPATITASDNCGTANVTFNEIRTNGDCNSNYTLERTWRATDAADNSTAFTQTITVQDTTAPEFVGDLPTDITVECDAIPEPETLRAFDNCGIATVTVNDANTPGTCLGSFTILRTWTATDVCNLTTTHTQTITVIDTTAPTPVQNIEEQLTVSCTEIPEVPEIEFEDNCSNNIIVVFNEIDGFDETVFENYQIQRTWTVRDACNNEAIYTQTLDVVLDEFVTTVTAPEKCYNDGVIDLNEFVASNNFNGTWEIVEGNTQATITGSIFDPTTLILTDDFKPGSDPITYLLRYTGLDDGCINITEVTMDINAECIVLPCGDTDVVVTKALTPNGDGFNDRFDIMGIELCGFIANVKIFNRWGALIFESRDYALGQGQGTWQGDSHNAAVGAAGTVPNGTYYYIITLENSGLAPFTGPIYIGTK